MKEYILLRHELLFSRYIGTNGKQLVPGQGASFVQTGLLHQDNQQLPTSRICINHSRTSGVVLWSYHANLAHGPTSHSVRAVELEEKDTEGGEKDEVQLDDLTDRVILWLTWLLKQMYHFYHYILHPNTCCCDIYQHACYVCVTRLIGYHAFLFHGGDYGMAAKLKKYSSSWICEWHAYLKKKRVRSSCRNQVFVSQFERFLYFRSVVCWTIAHFDSIVAWYIVSVEFSSTKAQ